MPAPPGMVTMTPSKVSAAADEVRDIVRRAQTAVLATLDQATGHPYASLVLVATATDGTPLLLLSTLARHTRNFGADPRVSLLFDATCGSAEPLTNSRATLIGRIEPTAATNDRRRYLARHVHAIDYADFADFAFYRLRPDLAHFIGGFGRIVELPAPTVLIPAEAAEQLVAAEAEILQYVNNHQDGALRAIATQLAGAPCEQYRATGIDPEGLDISVNGHTVRARFQNIVTTAWDAHAALDLLAHAARGASRQSPEGLT
jgi:putative heme iron utilization protein